MYTKGIIIIIKKKKKSKHRFSLICGPLFSTPESFPVEVQVIGSQLHFSWKNN